MRDCHPCHEEASRSDRGIALAYTPHHEFDEATPVHARLGGDPAGAHRSRAGAGGVEPMPGGLGRRRVSAARRRPDRPARNGKTVLLNWFKAACEDRKLDVVALTPDEIPNRAALIAALSPRTWMSKLMPRKVGVAAVGSVEWAASAVAPDNLARQLSIRCRKKAVVVLLDEAHTLDPEVGRTLLNASQKVRGEAPFPAGAGRHAGTAGASRHDERILLGSLGTGLLGIGLLSEAAAREALVEPLAAHGVGIDAGALDTVSEDSQCYPYFIQLWGRGAVGTAPGHRRHTPDSRGRCRGAPDVAAQVTNYYQRRYRELESGGLLPAAAALAPVFRAAADATASDPRGRRRPRHHQGGRRRPAGRPRGVEPARLRLVPAGPVAAGHLERRHSLADGPCARPRETTSARASASLMLSGVPAR